MKQTDRNIGAEAGGASNGAAAEMRFGRFFLSFRPNGYIGCVEFLILSLLGWAAVSIISFVLLLIWGGGVLIAAAPMAASEHYSGVSAVFAAAFSLICGLGALIMAAAAWLYHARLLQLRLIDMGLGDKFAVPGILSRYWICLLAVLIASPVWLILFIFCCLVQGRTYQDNRDLFAPIAPVPPADELERQMHARKMGGA